MKTFSGKMPDNEENAKEVANDEAQKEADEFDEEDILVHVEFDCEVDPGMFNSRYTFKIIGIDSGNPLIQIGDKVIWSE